MPLRSLQMRCPRHPACVNQQGQGHSGRCKLRCTKFKVGDTVHVYWSGDDRKYPGTIVRIDNENNTVDIFYADNDRDTNVPLALLRYPHTRPETKPRQQQTKERQQQHRQAAEVLLQLEESPVVAQHSELAAAYSTIRTLTATISAQAKTIAALEHQVDIIQGKLHAPTLSPPATRGTAVGL